MVTDIFGHKLIEGNRVPESATTGMRRGGQETVVCRMSAIDLGMGDAAEYCEVIAVFSQDLQVGRHRVVPAALLGKKAPGTRPRLLQIASMRRGVPFGPPVADELDRANAGRMASSRGSDRATPAPRRKCLRESARPVEILGRWLLDATDWPVFRGFIITIVHRISPYLARKISLCTNSWISLRTPYPEGRLRRRIASICGLSENRIGAPVA